MKFKFLISSLNEDKLVVFLICDGREFLNNFTWDTAPQFGTLLPTPLMLSF